jgi:copper chaperone CopZ
MSQTQKSLGEAIFSLDILGCSHCTSMMETELKELVGILSVELNNVAGTLRVNFDPSETTSDAIRYHLKELCQEVKSTIEITRRRPKPRRVS